MKLLIKRFKLLAIWVAMLTLNTQALAWSDDDDFERLFIFGDSLSDAGNVFALSGQTAQPPYEIIPSAPYDFRGFQFSNGKTWAQKFARMMDLKRSGKAALRKPGKFGNYAFGGARARVDSPSLVPSGPDQLNLYLADHGAADDDNLYVIQFGGNDVRDSLAVLMLDPQNLAGAIAIVQAAVQAEAGMVSQLYAGGARNFLVANVPNIALAPAVRLAGDEAVFVASMLVAAYNDGLEMALQGLELALPGISVNRLDFFGILNEVSANPKDYGIRNTEAACLMFFVDSDAICRKPNKYIFWDGIHPTAKVHKIVARRAAEIYD